MGDERAAFRAIQRGHDGDLDPQPVGAMHLALADALDLRRVQAIDLLAPLFLTLRARHPPETAIGRRRPACPGRL
jgi:hypothetical protein